MRRLFFLYSILHRHYWRIIDNGIIHGIDTCDHRKTRATTGFSRLIYNRVGVTWQWQVLTGNDWLAGKLGRGSLVDSFFRHSHVSGNPVLR